MKKIVLFPGQVASTFFANEIEYIKQNFEIQAIFSYGESREEAETALKRYQIDTDVLHCVDEIIINMWKFIKWFFSKTVLREIISQCIGKKKMFKRIAYCMFYGIYAVKVEQQMSTFNVRDDIVLYSFWMTRGAYAMEHLKQSGAWTSLYSIARAHGYDLYLERNEMRYLPFRNFINKSINSVSFISQNGLDYYTDLFPNFENGQVRRLGSYNEMNVRKEVFKKDRICIASCSSIIQIKRLDIMIDILSDLDLPIRWIHLGDGELKKKIEELASEKLNNTFVEYHFMGNVDNSKILDIYKKEDVDFFINTSDSEGIPVSIMEAISCGIPVLARNVGAIGEIVNEGTGLILDNIDRDKIRTFFQYRLQDEKKYNEYSLNCINEWKENYSAKKNYKDFFDKIRNNGYNMFTSDICVN